MKKRTVNYLFILIIFLSCLSWMTEGKAQVSDQDSLIVTKSKPSLDETKTVKLVAKSPKGAVIRSLIFPGWGQWYNDKKMKALLIFGTETGILINSIYLNQKYMRSTTLEEREFYIENRNLSNWYLVGSVLFSMADAFVDAHLSDFDESPDLSIKINPLEINGDFGVQFSICLNF